MGIILLVIKAVLLAVPVAVFARVAFKLHKGEQYVDRMAARFFAVGALTMVGLAICAIAGLRIVGVASEGAVVIVGLCVMASWATRGRRDLMVRLSAAAVSPFVAFAILVGGPISPVVGMLAAYVAIVGLAWTAVALGQSRQARA